MTAEEYAQLDDLPGFRDELIAGERVLSPSPKFAHTAVIEQLMAVLNGQVAELSPEPLQVVRESGWRFRSGGLDSVPVPDVMVVRAEDAKRAIKARGWFEGTPLLVIEVISPSERKERRLQKVGLYLDMSVPHVVEADYTKRLVLVHTPEAESAAVFREGDELTVPFRASVSEIFSVLD
jgi:Uma2 family endonuclease